MSAKTTMLWDMGFPMDNGQVGDTAILVLGSHRSGTSATTGVLYRLGVDLGANSHAGHEGESEGLL